MMPPTAALSAGSALIAMTACSATEMRTALTVPALRVHLPAAGSSVAMSRATAALSALAALTARKASCVMYQSVRASGASAMPTAMMAFIVTALKHALGVTALWSHRPAWTGRYAMRRSDVRYAWMIPIAGEAIPVKSQAACALNAMRIETAPRAIVVYTGCAHCPPMLSGHG